MKRIYCMGSVVLASFGFSLATLADEIDIPSVKPRPSVEAPYAFQTNNTTALPICYKDNKPTASDECQTIAIHNLTYWPMHYMNNRPEFLLAGFTRQNYGVGKPKLVRICGIRYFWKADVDAATRRITLYGQNDSKVTIPWALLFDDAQDQSTCGNTGTKDARSLP